MKYWNGTSWTTGTLKYWNGSSWVGGTLKYWDGTQWTTGTVTSSTLKNGLVSYWTLDESSGNATDSAGGSNTATANGTITYSATGKINTCFSFDGSTSYLDCGNVTNLSLTTTGTIALWFNSSDITTDRTMISKGNIGADRNGYTLGLYYTSLFCELADSSSAMNVYVYTSGNIVNNTWYHCAVTWNGTTVTLYLNATSVNSNTQITPVTNVYPFRIGARGDYTGGNLWYGSLDEIGVWNRALTSTEVALLYNSGSGLSYSSF